MPNNRKLKEDIAYVRAATERATAPTVPAIHLLWAVLGFCGFAMVDFADNLQWVGIYWCLAAPIGYALSAWLGRRASRAAGVANRELGVRHGLNWLGFMAAGVLGLALVRAGHLTWQGFGSLWVLLLALTYFQVGLHLERRMLPVGLTAAGAYLMTIWIPGFGWTAAGLALAAVLAFLGFIGEPRHEAAQ